MRSPERGAITIHVAIALIACLCFAGVVIDQGIFWTARRQAQNAADSGALAGAITLMESGPAYAEAKRAAETFAGSQQAIWGQATAASDIYVWPLPYNCPDGVPSCIRVDVFRGLPNPQTGDAHTNSFNTFLVRLAGPTTQGTRATATAQVAAGNAVQCIKPWVVADKWTDVTTGAAGGLISGAWDQMDTFDPATGDTYTPPAFSAAPGHDYGTQLVLKAGTNTGNLSSGWTLEIDLGATGSSAYEDEIEGCPSWVPTVGLYNPAISCNVKADEDPPKGCLGVKTGMSNGPTHHGVDTLKALDNSAVWNPATNTVDNSCMVDGSCLDEQGHAISVSARIVPLAIFDTASYAASGCSGTNCVAKVVNLLGYFIEGFCTDVYPDVATRPAYCGTPSEADKAVVGRLMAYPGQASSVSGSAGPATFLKVVRLIR